MTEPATRKQLDYLLGLGVNFEPDISKAEASKLIAKHVGRVNGNGRAAELAELRVEVDSLKVEVDYLRIPVDLWKDLLVLVHPDRHHGSSLEGKAGEATRWLLSRRPAKAGNRGARRPEGARTTRTV